MDLILLLLIFALSVLPLVTESLMADLLYLEGIGLTAIALLVTKFSSLNLPLSLFLVLFFILVIEGVLGLYGLSLVLSVGGKDLVNLGSSNIQ